MNGRVVLFCLFSAVAAPAAAAAAQQVEYLPSVARYRVTRTTTGTQESPMGSQRLDITVEQQLTLTLARRAADTLVASITIDSISLRSTSPLADVGAYRGAVFTALLSPTGRVYSSRAPEGADPLLVQLAEAMAKFLPAWRGPLVAGASWADTSSGRFAQQAVDVDRTIVTEYVVAGDTTVEGTAAVALRRRATMKASGRGKVNTNDVALETSSLGDALLFVTRDGRYLGGGATEDINLKLTIVAVGADVVVRQKTVQQVRPIP